MDRAAIHRLQKAVDTARQATHQARLDNCDVGDIDEAIEALDLELAKPSRPVVENEGGDPAVARVLRVA